MMMMMMMKRVIKSGIYLEIFLMMIFCVISNSEGKGSRKVMEVKIGIVLDKLESMEGKMGLSCINMALSDLYAANPDFNTRIVLHVRDFRSDVLLAAAVILDLVKNVQVAAIIGPNTSPEAQFVINVGERAQVPIVSYSATSTFLSPTQNPYFVRATQDESSQVQALSALVQAYGWREVVIIYVDNAFGGGILPSLLDSLQQIGTRVPYKSVIPLSSNDDQITSELNKLTSMQTRVFIVHMPPSLGSRLFPKAAQLGMMSQDYVWIVTNDMANVFNSLHPEVLQSMQGVLGIKTYVPKTRELQNFTIRWKTKFQQENPTILNPQMNVDGLWAYDATNALARAVEEVGIGANFTFQRAENSNSSNLLTDFSSFGVSLVGPRLLRAILSAKFRGMGGNFNLVDGELQSSTFELINVVGSGEKVIGYWTPSSGLIRETTLVNTRYSTSKSNLGSVIWPGDHTLVPKGWVTSPNGKKLQIGVPFKIGFSEFVKVTLNPATNRTQVTGYCIDVFDAVMAKLNYSVPYEYVPYAKKPDGQPTESYDELIYQVYQQTYDAVVGDVTITADRSFYVDFTLPYTESGVIMIAPMRKDGKRRAWLFVKPLTLDLWVTTFCFFIFMAFVIWVLEHRINEDFRGPPGHQVGTSLFYSFSTMVFSQSFSVFSNLTRFVVIVWVFVVLILTQSYTANLASLLTVEQLQPTITDVKELLRRGENVGYQEGSFVKNLLKEMKFRDSQLKPYNTSGQLDELLTKGTAKGGIAAAFDEIPYVKLVLDRYCSKYTTVSPTYKTDGFGFVFPLGSPLVSDVSRAVLQVIEGEEMTSIENKWFKQESNCPTSPFSSTSLSLDSFWGLFTIAGATAMFALIVSLAGFVHQHIHVLSDHSASVWTRIRSVLKIYDQKNLSSHTFRKTQQQYLSSVGTSSSSTNSYPQSPSSYWNNSERGFDTLEHHSTSSSKKEGPVLTANE